MMANSSSNFFQTSLLQNLRNIRLKWILIGGSIVIINQFKIMVWIYVNAKISMNPSAAYLELMLSWMLKQVIAKECLVSQVFSTF